MVQLRLFILKAKPVDGSSGQPHSEALGSRVACCFIIIILGSTLTANLLLRYHHHLRNKLIKRRVFSVHFHPILPGLHLCIILFFGSFVCRREMGCTMLCHGNILAAD
ncbi:uncharacterized protein LOC144074415 [Stigmatopora argus]